MKNITKLILITAVIFPMRNDICLGSNYTNQVEKVELQYNPPVIWGETTNFLRGVFDGKTGTEMPMKTSLRLGVQVRKGMIILSRHASKAIEIFPATVGLENLGEPSINGYKDIDQSISHSYRIPATNIAWVFLPPVNERLLLNMTDANGVLVPKTLDGLLLGMPLSLKPNTTSDQIRSRGMEFALFPGAGLNTIKITEVSKTKSFQHDEQEFIESSKLDPSRFFMITNFGHYKLTITLRVYVENTNSYLVPISLPPVAVQVDYTEK